METNRLLDRLAMTEYGIPGILLMDSAAMAVKKHLDRLKDYFVVICGTGNNGGDGLALAIKLKNLGKEVDVFLVSEGKMPEGDGGVFHQILLKMGLSLETISDEDHLWSFYEALKDSDVVIDALLGTGLKGDVSPLYQAVIGAMNDFSPKIIAVDVPSGLSADTGLPMPVAVCARKTVTFETIKKGLISYGAIPYVGELVVEPVGIPEGLIKDVASPIFFTDLMFVKSLMPKREITCHKGDYGRVLVVAGSRGFTGAAMLSCEAALATGSGLVTLCSYDETMEVHVPRLTEVMSLYEGDLEGGVRKADIVAFGPGLGHNEATFQLLLRVIKTLQEEGKSDAILVIDADGLNALEGRTEILKTLCFKVILTPHPGEMARLTHQTVKEVEEDRLKAAKSFAREHGVIVVLKGYHTVVTDGTTVYINSTGSSAMAQGGMGDVLTGMIASLSGQNMEPFEAAILGTYIHGDIGDQLALERYSVRATEIIHNIPFYMKNLLDRRIE